MPRPSVNSQLSDKAIQHAHYVEQFKNRQVQRIVGMFNDNVVPDINAQLDRRLENIASRGYDVSVARTTRLQQLQKAISDILSGGFSTINSAMGADLGALALLESNWQLGVLGAFFPNGINVSFERPATTLLRSIVSSRPMQGHLMRDWWKGVELNTRKKIVQQIQLGLVQGEDVPTMIKRVRGTAANNFTDGVYNASRRDVESIVRTATNHVTTQAREITYEENDHVVDQVQMVATLDSRTTLICMKMDKKIFPVNSGPRPPFHWNCRTTTVPVVKSWEELGIPGLKDIPQTTRASFDGQVAAEEDYGSWLKRQSDSFQNDALGPKRAELFRSGGVTVDDFVDNRGRMLTLDELAAKA